MFFAKVFAGSSLDKLLKADPAKTWGQSVLNGETLDEGRGPG